MIRDRTAMILVFRYGDVQYALSRYNENPKELSRRQAVISAVQSCYEFMPEKKISSKFPSIYQSLEKTLNEVRLDASFNK